MCIIQQLSHNIEMWTSVQIILSVHNFVCTIIYIPEKLLLRNNSLFANHVQISSIMGLTDTFFSVCSLPHTWHTVMLFATLNFRQERQHACEHESTTGLDMTWFRCLNAFARGKVHRLAQRGFEQKTALGSSISCRILKQGK